ncbi:hypothetical protein ILUMI_13588 [Ignelater luminosus]|uniref:Major facilitator superfamily (MFS) profile domain-containing protein n=1 Tax=Ignelater luminosus TaxID=2038154 RepID=A0A8K0D0G6_IGNLU|nr:hypothetical protein ILUMI_13588 [Ignelater luminosus]
MEDISVNEESRQWPQFVVVLTSLLLAVSSGVQYGWPSFATPKLLDKGLQFNISEEEVSYIIMIHPLGYILSGPISAFLQDTIGRKHTLLMLIVPQISAWLLIALSTNIRSIYLSRLISGSSEGCVFAILPVYICEISEPKIRGILGVSFSTAVVLGFLLITAYGTYMPLRVSAYVSISFPLLFFVVFIWMPESPYYLILKDNIDDARSSLKKLRKMKNVEDELFRIKEDIQRQTAASNSIKDVFTARNSRRALLILMGLRTLQQFSGGASVFYYNQVIFKQTGSPLYPIASMIFFATLALVSLSSLFFVDKYGRRFLLLISTSSTAVVLLIEALYFTFQYDNFDTTKVQSLPIAGLILYTIVRGIGLFSIPTLMSGELFSPRHKAKAIGILNIYIAICVSGTSKLFHYLKSGFGMHVPFYFFVFATSFGVLFVYFCVPETKGKTLEEIQQKLRGTVD